MRIAIAIVLLVVSGAAFADSPMKVKTKKKSSDHYYHHDDDRRHYKHRYRHDHYRHDRRRHAHHRYHHYDKKSHSRDWGIWVNFGSPGYYFHKKRYYQPKDYRRHIVHDYRPSDWITAYRFSAGGRHHSEQVIHIDARISALSLKGRHRDASVYRAYAELGNGRIIPLHSLEGHIAHGKRKGRYFYFNEPRYVARVFLSVDSKHRRKPAQIALNYVSVDRDYH